MGHLVRGRPDGTVDLLVHVSRGEHGPLPRPAGQYAWRARATDGRLTGPYTAWCHFRVDHTPPTAEVTTDATPKNVGVEATFTLKGTDTGSEIACARWQDRSV
ncbi:hypothetical protein [Streptomyces erythrochromogenes]|uniref:hypothetical protein n=1 Tax=Streptomyces erythrochromogenes TaxID=285574 RepID=UPI0037FF566D